jgi:hypothetical protein
MNLRAINYEKCGVSNAFTSLGFFWYLFFPKERCFVFVS